MLAPLVKTSTSQGPLDIYATKEVKYSVWNRSANTSLICSGVMWTRLRWSTVYPASVMSSTISAAPTTKNRKLPFQQIFAQQRDHTTLAPTRRAKIQPYCNDSNDRPAWFKTSGLTIANVRWIDIVIANSDCCLLPEVYFTGKAEHGTCTEFRDNFTEFMWYSYASRVNPIFLVLVCCQFLVFLRASAENVICPLRRR